MIFIDRVKFFVLGNVRDSTGCTGEDLKLYILSRINLGLMTGSCGLGLRICKT